MLFDSCNIVYRESPQGVFYSGQTVNGVFNIILEASTEILDMTFQIIGEAKTHWKQSHLKNKKKDRETDAAKALWKEAKKQANNGSVQFQGHEVFFKTPPITLTGEHPRQEGGIININEGLSLFNFSITLPPLLPSSIEGLFGKIRYYIELTAKRANELDKSKKFSFTVISTADLNTNPANYMPINQEFLKEFSSLFTKKGSLQMTIDLPMTGYASGQQIPIDCVVKNKSNILISSVTFSLERMVSYVSSAPFKYIRTEEQKLVEHVGKKVKKEDEIQLRVVLIIPSVPPTSVTSCLITYQYYVKVQAVATGMHSNLTCHIPVTIGNVPVRVQKYAGPTLPPTLEPSSSNTPDAPSQYSDSELPSYEKSQMSIAVD